MSVDVTGDGVPGSVRPKVGARLRLTLSYALFLLLAGAGILLGVYLVLRYVPDFPLTTANPGEIVLVSPSQTDALSREEILRHLVTTSGYILLALALIGFVGGWFLAGWIRLARAPAVRQQSRSESASFITSMHGVFAACSHNVPARRTAYHADVCTRCCWSLGSVRRHGLSRPHRRDDRRLGGAVCSPTARERVIPSRSRVGSGLADRGRVSL